MATCMHNRHNKSLPRPGSTGCPCEASPGKSPGSDVHERSGGVEFTAWSDVK